MARTNTKATANADAAEGGDIEQTANTLFRRWVRRKESIHRMNMKRIDNKEK